MLGFVRFAPIRRPAASAPSTSPTPTTPRSTSGVDVQLNWGTDLGGGDFNLNFVTSYLDSFKTRLNPTAPWSVWRGTFGPAGLSGVNAGAFDYRTFTTASFSRGDWNVALRWRHLPSIKPSAIVSNPATNIIDTPSYDAFDLSGGYTFRESWQLRYGVDNVFDEQPLFTNATRCTRGTAVNGGFLRCARAARVRRSGRELRVNGERVRATCPGLAASPESCRAMRPTSQRAVASIVADGVRRLESRRVLRFGCRPTL